MSLHRATAQLIGSDRALCRRRSAALGSLHHRLEVSVADRLQLVGQRGQLGVIVPTLHLPRQSALLAVFQHTAVPFKNALLRRVAYWVLAAVGT